MNNWRLLLLALVAILQPIGSFTERNVFDGRQCCDRQLQSFSRVSNRLIDDYHLDKASTEERRVNRNAIRHIKHFETTLGRRSTERVRGRVINSAPQSRTQEKINTNHERLERHKRNYRSTRQVLDFQRFSQEHNDRTRNTRDVRNANEIRRPFTLKIKGIMYKRERKEINRRESREKNIRQVSRHLMSAERRTFLDETREFDTIRRRSLSINRRSREYVIESRRSGSLPNMRTNKRDRNSSGDRLHRVSFKQREITVQDIERRSQPTENRVSIRRISRDRILTRNTQQDSVIQRVRDNRTNRNSMIENYDVNMYRNNIIQKRLETREETRRAASRGMDREFINNELNHRTRYSVRRDYRDVSPTVKVSRSAESRRNMSRVQINYETVREKIMERESVDLRNLRAVARVRENFSGHQNREHFKNQTNGNWLNILYTLQGIYLCGIFLQMINGDDCKKLKSRNLHWWALTSSRFIKVE